MDSPAAMFPATTTVASAATAAVACAATAAAPSAMTSHAEALEVLGGLIDSVAEADRLIASFTALRAELIEQVRMFNDIIDGPTDDLYARSLSRRALRAELACELRLPECTVENLLIESELLVHNFRPTLDAVLTGAISYRHAKIIIDNAASLDDAAAEELEAAALQKAASTTAARFDRIVRKLRERTHPESINERHQRAVADREVQFAGGRDGMAWLSAYLPASGALAAYNRITELAIGMQAPDETRTLTQLRADVFADLLLDGATTTASNGIHPTVLVTVPVLTLLHRSEAPGNLDGYGPIDAATARRLAGKATSFIRLLTDPETGAVLSVGRRKYQVPEDLKTWLRVRDETCRFPGCNRDARHCDLDHTTDWAIGGETRYDNLAHLCPSHHKLKHETRWQVTQARDGTGTLKWTSPSGRRYDSRPETTMSTRSRGG